MDTNKMKSIMALNGDNQKKLAKVLELSEQRFSKKLNEREGAEFTQSEISAIKTRYNLSAKKVDEIFFNLSVS